MILFSLWGVDETPGESQKKQNESSSQDVWESGWGVGGESAFH